MNKTEALLFLAILCFCIAITLIVAITLQWLPRVGNVPLGDLALIGTATAFTLAHTH